MPAPEKVWQRLVDEEAGDDAIEAAERVSVTQAERELAAAGFDAKAERARGEALIAELIGEKASLKGAAATEPSTESTTWVSGPPPAGRSPSSRKVVWLAAALVAAAAAGGVFYAASRRPPPDKPDEVPSATVSAAPPTTPAPPSETAPVHAKPTASRLDPK